MREAKGRVLYVTQSAYLAQSARALYDHHGYENPEQEPEFLSYREFLETLQVPKGREISFGAFGGWFDRHRAALKGLGNIDAHALYEEFRAIRHLQAWNPPWVTRWHLQNAVQPGDAQAQNCARTGHVEPVLGRRRQEDDRPEKW